MNPIRRCRALNGFSLVELMLSLSLGLGISGVMLQGLMAEGQNGARFSQLLRERANQWRVLDLVQQDVLQSTAVSTPPTLEQHACNLAGRQPVLHLNTTSGPVTYSVGVAPSRIWRGQVLMRCGPAYGSDGQLSKGIQVNNRVLIDALDDSMMSIDECRDPSIWNGFLQSNIREVSRSPFLACHFEGSGVLVVKINQILRPGYPGRGFKVSSSRLVSANFPLVD